MLIHNEPMGKHCTLRTGGLARDFFIPSTVDALSNFLKNNQKPILMLGLGSNLLVRDSGFDGVVIKLQHFNQLAIVNGIVEVGAGTTLAKLARFCELQGFNGGEFLSAIPGNVGGALAMNAGAFGGEIWQFVKSVVTINHRGIVRGRKVSDFDIDYRYVLGKNPDEYFIGAYFQFKQNKPQNEIKALLAKRRQLQPSGQPSCGSVFKNPKLNFAAKLIEDSDLKGVCMGGACVSNQHANFIINQNNATASDVEALIKHIQQTVKSKFGIALETEVKVI